MFLLIKVESVKKKFQKTSHLKVRFLFYIGLISKFGIGLISNSASFVVREGEINFDFKLFL